MVSTSVSSQGIQEARIFEKKSSPPYATVGFMQQCEDSPLTQARKESPHPRSTHIILLLPVIPNEADHKRHLSQTKFTWIKCVKILLT